MALGDDPRVRHRCPTPSVPRPELVDFQNLTKSNARHNLEHAFSVAERHLGITPLLDPEGEAAAANPPASVSPLHPGTCPGPMESQRGFYPMEGGDLGGSKGGHHEVVVAHCHWDDAGWCRGWVRTDASRLRRADVFTENPDEKSIITYVVAFYHYFSKMKVLEVEGRRLGKVGDDVEVRGGGSAGVPAPHAHHRPCRRSLSTPRRRSG